jgi:hypothetical protein
MKNPEQDVLDALRRDMGSAEALFSNTGQDLQERTAVAGFLRVLGIDFREDEIIKCGPEPIDICFREARFQVTEILDPGRPRNLEIKQRADRARAAKSLGELVEPGTASSHSLGPNELLALTLQRTKEKARKYAGKCDGIDLLIYVNLLRRHMNPAASIPRSKAVESVGWRSVSVIMERFAAVLWAADNAPSFLIERRGQTIPWQDLDSVFPELGKP